MKRLTLIRHAKAEPALAGQEDWERALEASGVKDAQEMGRRLKTRGLKPHLLLTSPAARALATAKHIGQVLCPKLEIVQKERLYLAQPKLFFSVLHEADAAAEHIIVVGHNPGISEFADALSSERRIDNMPTAAIVTMEVDVSSWDELDVAMGVDVEFDWPSRMA